MLSTNEKINNFRIGMSLLRQIDHFKELIQFKRHFWEWTIFVLKLK